MLLQSARLLAAPSSDSFFPSGQCSRVEFSVMFVLFDFVSLNPAFILGK
jgi:hypothetical protein